MPSSSESQRRFFGIVHGMKKGKVPKKYSPKAAKTAQEMTMGDVRDFASGPVVPKKKKKK